MKKYLLFVSHSYAFPILRPLQKAIRERGGRAAWFLEDPRCRRFLKDDEEELATVGEVIEYDPLAIFTPGNHIYHFFPGIKVQVFHGFDIQKRPGRGDHFAIRGWFDLYCLSDATTAGRFHELARRHGSFRVAETGWTKLDFFFDKDGKIPEPKNDPPVILYCSTFTGWITSTPYLYDEIERLAKTRPWRWIITFHPKMDADTVARYKGLTKYPNVEFYDGDNNVGALREADVMLSDSSSIIYEFLYMRKPAVTFRNTSPGDFLIDISDPAQVEGAIEKALTRPSDLMENIRARMDAVHPWRDGKASERALDAVDDFAAKGRKGLKRKKPGLVRRYKARRAAGYYKICKNRKNNDR